MHATGRVIVLDCEFIPALDVVRSLGMAGLRVTAAAAEDKALGFSSRYCSDAVVYPDPRVDADKFLDWLQQHLERNKYDLLVPVTDFTVIPVSMDAARLGRFCKIATERFETMEKVYDKRKTLELAQELGIPIPESLVIEDIDQLPKALGAMTYPVVCKPAKSKVWSRGGSQALSVSYAFNADQAVRLCEPHLGVTPVIVQSYFRGRGVGVEILACAGQICQIFQHERLHEVPITGGASTYRKSVPIAPQLAHYTSRLIAKLNWTGVAMVEFKVNDDGEARLVEINGRFWGSLPLSSRAGMSFGADLYDLLVRGECSPPRQYRVGVRCRQLRRDLMWFKECLSLDHASPFVVAGMVKKAPSMHLIKEAISILSPRNRLDVQVLKDPVPGIVDVTRIASQVLDATFSRVLTKSTDPLWAWRQWLGRRRLERALGTSRRLLFVCYGNILRSPFAAAYCSTQAEPGDPALEVRSAGTLKATGRPAPEAAVREARAWNVNLREHRSTTLTRDLIAWADLIFVMDRNNMEMLRRDFPDASDRVFPLGLLGTRSPNGLLIRDPYGQGDEALRATYVRIASAVDALIRALSYRGVNRSVE